MTKLLFIKASPSGALSKSIAIAEAYVNELRARQPDLAVDMIDLWEESLPAFDGNKANAKLAVVTKTPHSAEQKTAWDKFTAIARRFVAADRYVFAVPMWNGNVSYKLKQYIDIIHQPGLLFAMNSATGYVGLLHNKKATSGVYALSAPSRAFGVDRHASYLKAWLNQAGVTDIEGIRYQPTLRTADPAAGFAAAIDEARSLTNKALEAIP